MGAASHHFLYPKARAAPAASVELMRSELMRKVVSVNGIENFVLCACAVCFAIPVVISVGLLNALSTTCTKGKCLQK